MVSTTTKANPTGPHDTRREEPLSRHLYTGSGPAAACSGLPERRPRQVRSQLIPAPGQHPDAGAELADVELRVGRVDAVVGKAETDQHRGKPEQPVKHLDGVDRSP